MVQATVYFLARDPVYDTVKPYTLRYQPAKSIPLPRTNCKREAHEIQVEDLRTREKDTTRSSTVTASKSLICPVNSPTTSTGIKPESGNNTLLAL